MTKAVLKQYLRHNALAYLAAEVLYENALYVPLALRQALSALVLRLRTGALHPRRDQSVLTWDVPFPSCAGPDDLVSWLRSRGVEVNEGGHTFYIRPQPGLRDIIPSVVDFYPPGSGFKVLKDFRDPLHARYIFLHPRSLRMLKSVIGTPQEQLPAANQMHALGIGPRVWDLCCWKGADGRSRYSVFVIEHVAGREPSVEQCRAFLRRLQELHARGDLRILAPRWQHTEDFQPPHCNRNLVYSDACGLQYVDFQNFGLSNRGGWAREMTAARKQEGRWLSVCRVLRDAGIDVDRRLILDVACGDGSRLHAALADGAAWGIGWDDGNAIRLAGGRLLSRGAARFSLVAADLAKPRRLQDDVAPNLRYLLPDAIVFCPAGRSYLPALRSICAMPWSVLVLEGGVSESVEEIASRVTPAVEADGTTRIDRVLPVGPPAGARTARPIVVLTRKPVPQKQQHVPPCLESFA